MKFKTKLYASIGSLLLLISVIVVILMNMLEQSTVNMNVVVNDLYERIDMASDIKYETIQLGRELLEITTITSNEDHQAELNAWEKSQVNIQLAIESLEEKDTQAKSQELIAKFKTLLGSYQQLSHQIMSVEPDRSNIDSSWNEAELTRKRMLQIAELIHGLQEQEMKNELLRSRETYNWAVTIIYIYLAAAVTIGIGLTIFIIRRITKNLNTVSSVMKSVPSADFERIPRIEITSKDEIGEISSAFNKMAVALEEHSRIEKQLIKEAEEQSWLKTKVAEIATMYPEVESLHMLAKRLITRLVPMVDASYGVFYMKDIENGTKYLNRIASYAFSKETEQYHRFAFGEGLVGQCAVEKRPIILNEVPDHYVKINSGTGESSPRNIIIFPVQYENEVLGVIEIAALKPFDQARIKLLEEINSNIGITMNSIANRMRAETLLQESQALTEELQTQSEELQLQQEELRTTNEKLEEQYEASEQKNREIEKVREALEEKAQQLELSSQYKSEFLANVSHELRTPLNSLLILAQILSENGEGNLTEKQKEYIRTIYSSGNDLLHLINDILDLAKVESGKLDVINKEVDFNRIHDFIVSQFSPIAEQKNLNFAVELDKELPSSIKTDEHRLQQILKNLLSNAFKFTESGSVSLVIKKVFRNLEGSTGMRPYLSFSVTDTGIGIAEENQETIFDAFKQADGTTSRQYGGTGLGLSISREVAHLLKGFIEVSSKKGQGSTFTLYLPHFEEVSFKEKLPAFQEVSVTVEDRAFPLTKQESKKQDIKHGKSLLIDKKVLIVDDDIRNVYALTIALEQYGMNIIVAENGREGIQMLQENPDTDLILMDIMMPELDGFEAMRRIRKIPRFHSLPIIALTAKAMKNSREECLNAGATDYISKPINLDQLYSLMQVWLYSKEG